MSGREHSRVCTRAFERAVAYAVVRIAVMLRTTRRRVNANISPTSVTLDERTVKPLSLRFYAPIFALCTHIPSFSIPSASCRRTSAISTRHCTRLSLIIDASYFRVYTRLSVFLEKKLKRTGNAFLYIYNFLFSASRIARASRRRCTRACERRRTWVGTRAVRAGVRFDVSTLQSTSARIGQPAELRM